MVLQPHQVLFLIRSFLLLYIHLSLSRLKYFRVTGSTLLSLVLNHSERLPYQHPQLPKCVVSTLSSPSPSQARVSLDRLIADSELLFTGRPTRQLRRRRRRLLPPREYLRSGSSANVLLHERSRLELPWAVVVVMCPSALPSLN